MAALDEYLQLLRRQTPLSSREKLVLAVGNLATELDMGGASGFLYNASPDASSSQRRWVKLRETVDALSLIGARKATRTFQALLPKLERSAKGDGTWGGFLDARAIDLTNLDDRIESGEDLFRLLDAHLASKKATPKKKSPKKAAPKASKKKVASKTTKKAARASKTTKKVARAPKKRVKRR